MYYFTHYHSPIGPLTLAANNNFLIGLWMDHQKHFAALRKDLVPDRGSMPVLQDATTWLDDYFAGNLPDIAALPLCPEGSGFRRQVWQLLTEIPYGETTTYGELSRCLGREQMSAQAVGGAVGHNPISIIIPCHRVVGANGSLTGYAGGLARKLWLLRHEGVDLSSLIIPPGL